MTAASAQRLLLATFAAAWALILAAQATGGAALVHHDALIESGPPPARAAVLFLVAWQVMIAATMLPSSMPMLAMFRRASAGQPEPGRALAAFVGAYALVWTAFGGLAFAGDMGVHALASSWGWLEQHPGVILGSTLAVAGAFQLTALKDRCLEKCRHPAMFMTRHYRRGAGGAFELGARHATFCVGCCWALMLLMFAVGVASLPLMAAMAALMYHEKTRPSGARAVPVTGAVLLGAASVVLAWSLYTGAA